MSIGLKNAKDDVFYFELSRHSINNNSAFAGLFKCTGVVAAVIPYDEQQPCDTVAKTYPIWGKGEKIVFPGDQGARIQRFPKYFRGCFTSS